MLQGFSDTRKGFKFILCIIVLLVFCLAIPLCALAGNGDGTGGGKTTDFALTSSDPTDGSVDVALDKDIVLLFNKNAVNLAVRDNNMKCFTMKDAAGNAVSITVNMVDDQVDPTYKRYITIDPDKNLASSTKYTLTISGDLQAKSGSSLENPVSISFTTIAQKAAAASDKTTTSSTGPDQTITVPASSTDSQAASQDVDNNAQTDQNTEQAAEDATGLSVPGYVIVIWVVVIALIVYMFAFKRKKK